MSVSKCRTCPPLAHLIPTPRSAIVWPREERGYGLFRVEGVPSAIVGESYGTFLAFRQW